MSSNIAIVHDRLTELGGAEQVIEQLALEWPASKVHAPLVDPGVVPELLRDRVVTTSTDRLHRALGRRSHAPVLPLVPASLRRHPIEGVDAVVISHFAFGIAATQATSVPTVAYVHSPARWAWDKDMRAQETASIPGRAALTALSAIARRNETKSAPLLTKIVANSSEVRDRISQWWGRESTVVFPPVNVDRYTVDTSIDREDFFLLAGRLVPYKRADLAVRAAREAGVRLVVAGDGRFRQTCEQLAGPETVFLGRVSDDEMLRLQRTARALLMPGVEDFGIVPVEAMAVGTPVLAVGAGGAVDTVIPGLSGEHITPGSDDEVVARFADAMRYFDPSAYNAAKVRAHAERFSQNEFRASMRAVVDSVI